MRCRKVSPKQRRPLLSSIVAFKLEVTGWVRQAPLGQPCPTPPHPHEHSWPNRQNHHSTHVTACRSCPVEDEPQLGLPGFVAGAWSNVVHHGMTVRSQRMNRVPWRGHAAPNHRRVDLVYTDRNLRFHRYDPAPATAHVVDLLAEIDRDPTGIFWG